jgi:hypothetical protein
MPTSNPRIIVTVSPSLDALVDRLARLQRVSKSQVLRELLEAAEPALQRAAALMDAASTATSEVLSKLAADLDRAQSDAEAVRDVQLARADAMTADLVAEAEAIRGRRPVSAQRAPAGVSGSPRSPKNPPVSNRGVKSTKRGRPSSNVRVKR